MAFLQDVGNWLGNIFGTQQSKNATQYNQTGQAGLQKGLESAGKTIQQAQAAQQNAAALQKQAQDQAGYYQQGAKESMGQNAAEEQQKAMQSAQGAAQTAGRAAGSQSAGAARTGGLNKGQAALMGSNAATEAYQQQIPQQVQNYYNAANQFQQGGQTYAQQAQGAAGLGQSAIGLQQQGAGLQTQAGSNAADVGQKNSSQAQQGGGGLLGGIANGIGQLLVSDERLKKDIGKEFNLREIMAKVKPITYRYKDEPESEPKRMGVTAQDLEKTPMKTAVVDTPQGKMIDTNQLVPQLLNLTLQLAKKVYEDE